MKKGSSFIRKGVSQVKAGRGLTLTGGTESIQRMRQSPSRFPGSGILLGGKEGHC